MVLSLFQKEKKVGFSSSSDICSLDILHCLMNGLPFSQGQGTFYYELGKMSAIDHCKRGAKRRCSLSALISTSAIFPREAITRLCSSLHIMVGTILVKKKKWVKSNLFGIFSAVSKCFMIAMFRTLTESVWAKRFQVLKPPYMRHQSSLCIFLHSFYDLNFFSLTADREQSNNSLNAARDLIRHLRHLCGENPPGAKCAARLKPAALKCWWVDADWWGGWLKGCGEKGRRWLRGG